MTASEIGKMKIKVLIAITILLSSTRAFAAPGGVEITSIKDLVTTVIRTAPAKDEFTSDANHSKKVAAWKDKPLMGKKTPKDTFFIKKYRDPKYRYAKEYDYEAYQEYDANSEKLTLGAAAYVIRHREESRIADLVGTTAFGVSKAYYVYQINDYEIYVDDCDEKIETTLSVSPREAKSLRNQVYVVYEIKLTDPIEHGESSEIQKATLDRPWEDRQRTKWIRAKLSGATLIDVRTGKVLWKQKICAPPPVEIMPPPITETSNFPDASSENTNADRIDLPGNPSNSASASEVIEKFHPNYISTMSESKFKEWLSSQEPEVKSLMQSSSYEDTIRLLDMYKTAE